MLKIENLTKTYDTDIEALKGVSLDIAEGEFIAILGRSGAGKSSLIRCINGLVKPDRGTIEFNGLQVTSANKQQLIEVRRNIGVIFQQFNLVKRMSVLGNVLSGRLGQTVTIKSILRLFSEKDHSLANKALERVGLIQYSNHEARALSGGQQQRVAIARALVQEPRLILGDEPVASLDPTTARSIIALLKDINVNERITILLNMHTVDLALEFADRVVGLKAGKIVYDGPARGVSREVLEDIYE